MGCGKSTLGKALAQRCDIEFIDLDVYIETRTGKKYVRFLLMKAKRHSANLNERCSSKSVKKLTYLWHVAAGLHVSATICRS